MRLSKQSNQWVLHHQATLEDKKIEKEIRVNLNKLTPENFDIIKPILAGLAATSEFVSEQLIKMLLLKSQTEIKYAKLYAELYVYLNGKVKFNTESNKRFFSFNF